MTRPSTMSSVQFAWLEYLNAYRNVTRHYRRSLFGIFSVTFGVVALLLAAGFIDWTLLAIRESTIHTGMGHLQIMRAGYLKGGQADPLRYLMPQVTGQSAAIAALPMVRSMAPRLAFNGLVSHNEATISFIGEGMDPDAEREVSGRLLIAAGENLAADDAKGILLGTGLAANLGVHVGDTVVLLVNSSTGGISAVECTVRGLFNTISKAYDDAALRVPLAVAQKLLRVTGIHRWIVLLDDTAQTQQVLADLRQRYADGELEFVPWSDLADVYNKTVPLFSKQINFVEFIIAVIIVLSISNTMMMNVLERTAEIGTCLAIGRSRWQILRQFVYEGLTIGLSGAALGLILGYPLALTISAIGIPMPPPPGMSQGYSGEILVSARLAADAILLALGTTLVASCYPAWRASHLEIVDALRHAR